jgi:hypothetical protein
VPLIGSTPTALDCPLLRTVQSAESVFINTLFLLLLLLLLLRLLPFRQAIHEYTAVGNEQLNSAHYQIRGKELEYSVFSFFLSTLCGRWLLHSKQMVFCAKYN